MNRVTYNLGRPIEYHLHPDGDFHIGVEQNRWELLLASIAEIRKDPDALFLGMGDYCEFREPGHKFRREESTIEGIEEQVKKALGLFKSVDDKCIGILIGNHEEGLCAKMDYNPFRVWCEDHDVPYLGSMARLEFRYKTGKKHVVIATHGHRVSESLGSDINRATGFMGHFDIDAYLQGHNHKLAHAVRTELIDKDGKWARRYKYVGFTGGFYDGFLDNSVSYAETYTHTPLPIGHLIVDLRPDGLGMRSVYM